MHTILIKNIGLIRFQLGENRRELPLMKFTVNLTALLSLLSLNNGV